METPSIRNPVPTRIAERLVRTLTIEHQGASLSAALNLPLNSTGLVLFAHASANGHESPRNQYLTQCLALRSIAVLQVSLLTNEEDAETWIADDLKSGSVLLAGRLAGALEWSICQPYLQHLGLGCMGFGAAGTAALMAAAERSNLLALAVADAEAARVGKKLEDITSPTLLLTSDSPDLRKDNEMAYDRLRCERELAVIPATNALANGDALQDVAELVLTWFKRHLRAVGCAGPVATS